MNRETRTITLPKSKWMVDIITYWTWRDRKTISIALFGDAKLDVNNPSPQIDGLSIKQTMEAKEKTIELAVKSVKDENGVEKKSDEILDLEEKDVEFLLKEIDAISNDEVKKNS